VDFWEKETHVQGMYTISKNIPIAKMEYKDFMEAIKPYLKGGGNNCDTITAEEMKKGVAAGFRHYKAISFAYHLVAKARLGHELALQELRRFGKTCDPPLTDVEYFKRAIIAAAKHEASKINKPVEYVLAGTEQRELEQVKNNVDKEIKLNDDIERFGKSIQTIEQELGLIDWCYPEIDDKHPFNPNELAEMILARPEYGILTDKTTKNLYFYSDRSPVYHQDGEVYLRSLIEKLLMSEAKINRINEVVELIKIKTYATLKPSKKIAVENGTLDLETKKLEPPSKYDFITNKIQAVYNPDAPKYEPWLKFIDEVCPDDKPVLQEFSGYCLEKGLPFHVITWLIGQTGRNGKGTYIRTMKGILGPANVSNVQVHELQGNNKFAAFNLIDKLLNVSNEPNTKYPLSVEMLLALSGKDTLSAEQKNVQGRCDHEYTTKLVIVGNTFPQIIKPTRAFWERLNLIDFPNTFIGEKQKQDLEDTWLNDPDPNVRSAILNWMIEGRDRLFNNSRFTRTKTKEQMVIKFKRASDTTAAFIAERGEYDKNAFTSRIEASCAYKDYCEDFDLEADTPAAFNAKLRADTKIKETAKRLGIGKDKKLIKGWEGFKLKKTEDVDFETDEQEKLLPVLPVLPVSTSENILKTKKETSIESGNNGNSGNKTVNYEQLQGKAVVKHVRAAAQCFNGCALLAEWQVRIDPDFEQYFCNDCFNKAKRNLEENGFSVEFAEEAS
jgi:P4 family phage/plasmid primase-like protien